MTCNLQKQIINTYYNDYKFFFSKPNVEGIGFGYKSINGIYTGEPCILVFVETKVPKDLLLDNGLIPTFYKGIKTDVIQTGSFSTNTYDFSNSNSSCIPIYVDKIRPIQSGFCIGLGVPSEVGTLGYIVTDNTQVSQTYCLLSTTVCFAMRGFAPLGSEIIQPSLNFKGKLPDDLVARLLRFVPIKLSHKIPNSLNDFNTIDGAIASYVNIGPVQLLNPIIPGMGIPIGKSIPEISKPIQWTGCISGHQNGTITSVSSIIKVKYHIYIDAYFKDIVLTKGPLSFAGDFGALVCDLNKSSMGMLFARSMENNSFNAFCTLDNIERELNITVLSL